MNDQMSSDQMSILEDLSAGRIDAAEAARRIEALKQPTASDDAPRRAEDGGAEAFDGGRPQYATHAREDLRPPQAPAAEPAEPVVEAEVVEEPAPTVSTSANQEVPPREQNGARGVNRVVVRSVGRRVRIVGDAGVATLNADGPHVLRRTGTTLEVTADGDIGPSLKGFNVLRPPKNLGDLRTLGLGQELVVTVNPAIPVDVEVTGGGLTIAGVPVVGRLRLTVGSLSVEGVREMEDALVQTGSATVRGDISQGRSRIRVESGNLNLHLGKQSNVTVRATSQWGRVSWPGEASGRLDEYVVGNGSARLDLGVVMGNISVHDDAETLG